MPFPKYLLFVFFVVSLSKKTIENVCNCNKKSCSGHIFVFGSQITIFLGKPVFYTTGTTTSTIFRCGWTRPAGRQTRSLGKTGGVTMPSTESFRNQFTRKARNCGLDARPGVPAVKVGETSAPGMHWKGGSFTPPPPAPSRAPSLCPATVSLTPSASFNGICNRQ